MVDDAQVDRWLATASLEDRCRLLAGRDFWSLHGIEVLGIPPIVVTDGPHGVRLQASSGDSLAASANLPATCFPTASALASSWDPELVERVGVALGVESRALGVSVLLGPGANIKRTPLCGRNFEYFSEDPLPSSAMAAAWVRGIQSQGVGASLKHLAANNQETLRFSVDAVVDERALREVYLASFEHAVVEARPWTMMAAYNRVGGEYATENEFLLDQVLRRQWGFDGVVMSDWGATDDRVAALRAGLDLQMPGQPDAAEPVVAAVREGRLDVAVVDRAVRRLVDLVRRTAPARAGTPPVDGPPVGGPEGLDVDAHHRLAEEAAAAGAVLLHNDGLLPLSPDAHLAVLGQFAEQPRFQGAGSSVINARRVVPALDALRARARVSYAPGYRRYDEEPDPGLLADAARVAAGADVAVVMVGLPEMFETEGTDREHLRLPAAQDALVRAVAAANPRTVVVLSNGAPVELPWLRQVSAVLEAYLGGQESGGAVARMLLGELEPGGRLAETFPVRWTDHPVHDLPLGPRYSEYRESLYVGYRWFDTVDADVAFPFGHGLGYTSFDWTGAELSAEQVSVDALAAGEAVTVRVTVTNTGARAGSEVVQVYLRPQAPPVFRPRHELKAFRKVHLEPGASATVELPLGRRSFAHWDTATGDWLAAPGGYVVEVAASSRDVRAELPLELTADPSAATVPAGREGAAPVPVVYASPARGQWFDRASFEALLGRPLGPNEPDRPGAFTLSTPLSQLGTSRAARWLRGLVADRFAGRSGDDPVTRVMVRSTLEDASPRMLLTFAHGAVSRTAAEAAVLVANRRPLAALRLLRRRGGAGAPPA
jgi:beta-glucosidase